MLHFISSDKKITFSIPEDFCGYKPTIHPSKDDCYPLPFDESQLVLFRICLDIKSLCESLPDFSKKELKDIAKVANHLDCSHISKLIDNQLCLHTTTDLNLQYLENNIEFILESDTPKYASKLLQLTLLNENIIDLSWDTIQIILLCEDRIPEIYRNNLLDKLLKLFKYSPEISSKLKMTDLCHLVKPAYECLQENLSIGKQVERFVNELPRISASDRQKGINIVHSTKKRLQTYYNSESDSDDDLPIQRRIPNWLQSAYKKRKSVSSTTNN